MLSSVLVLRFLEDTVCGLGLGLAQWSCLHVIDVNKVNSNTVTIRLDCVVRGKDIRECDVCVQNG